MIGVYSIRLTGTTKAYIGSSTNITKRFKEHRRDLDGGCHTSVILQRAVDRYGISAFVFEIVELCPRETRIEREQFYLDSRNSCYNVSKLAAGGSRKEDWTLERRANHSKAQFGNQATKGLIWSDQARANMSAAVKGKPRTEAQVESTKQSLELGRQTNRVNKPGMNWRILRSIESGENEAERKEKSRLKRNAYVRGYLCKRREEARNERPPV